MINTKKWYKQSNPDDNLCAIALTFLHTLNVPFFKKYIQEFLYSHKSYPNLTSVAALMNNLNVDSLITKVDYKDLKLINTPIIAYLSTNRTFIVVIEVSPKYIRYINSTSGYENENIEVFLKNWSGFVLMAETNAKSGENQIRLKYNNYLRVGMNFLLIVFLFFSAVISIHQYENVDYLKFLSLFSLNLLGVFFSFNILRSSYRDKIVKHSKFYKNIFFKGFHSNMGYERNSLKFKLFKITIYFDDLTSILFLGNLLMFCYYPEVLKTPNLIFAQLIILVFFLLLFILTLYDFLKVSKQLCIPRLFLFLIVVSTFLILLKELPNKFILNDSIYVWHYFLNFGFTAFVFFEVKNSFINLLTLTEQNSEFKHFKESKPLLLDVLGNKVISIPKPSPFDLYFGNPHTDKIITLVIQPNNHLSLKYLIEAREFSTISDNYKFLVLLYSNTLETKMLTKTIISNALENGNEKAIALLFQWYKMKAPVLSEWLKKNYLNPKDVSKINEQINSWNKFIEKELKAIPSVLFEGKLMPHYLSFKNFESYFEKH